MVKEFACCLLNPFPAPYHRMPSPPVEDGIHIRPRKIEFGGDVDE